MYSRRAFSDWYKCWCYYLYRHNFKRKRLVFMPVFHGCVWRSCCCGSVRPCLLISLFSGYRRAVITVVMDGWERGVMKRGRAVFPLGWVGLQGFVILTSSVFSFDDFNLPCNMVRLCNSSMQVACVCISSSAGVEGWLGCHRDCVVMHRLPACLPAWLTDWSWRPTDLQPICLCVTLCVLYPSYLHPPPPRYGE